MDRRTLLYLASPFALMACANQGPRPTLATIDIRRVGLLTLKEVPVTGNIGPFNVALSGTVTPAGSVVPITPATLGMGIGLALRAKADAEAASARATISNALQPVGLSPKMEFTKALSESLLRRSIPISAVESDAVGERARTNWDFTGLPPGLDAVLDVQIDYCGYFFEKEAGGFSPSLYISGTLLATASGGARLERYYYRADYRESEGDRRFITTAPTLTVARLEQFRERAPAIRQGMKELFALVADRLAEDVERSIKRQPKL